MTLNPNERTTDGVGCPQRPTLRGDACPRTTGRRAFLAGALALVVLLCAAPAAAQAQGQERVATTLWQQYPLDPTKGKNTKARPRASPKNQRPGLVFGGRSGAQDGDFPWLFLAAAVGAVFLLEILLVGLRVAVPTMATTFRRVAASRPAAAGGARRRPARSRRGRRPPDASPSRAASLRHHAEPGSHPRPPAVRPHADSAEEAVEPARLKPLPGGAGPVSSKPPAGPSPPPGGEPRVRSDVGSTQRPGSTANDAEAGRGTTVEHGETAAVPWPRAPARVEQCQIVWWRGYVMSDFYALTEGHDGQTDVVARSRSFLWPHSETPPQRGSAAEAHAGLLDTLAASGWKAIGRAPSAWYATRLQRAQPIPLQELQQQLGGRRR